MKNVYIIACFIAAFILGACGGSDSPAYDNSLVPANATKPVTPVTIADTLLSDTAKTTAAINTTPVVTQSQAVPAKTTAAISTTPAVQSRAVPAKITAGLNPAHGQPGHRCDISVGAPLNSPVQNISSPQVQSSPVTPTPVIQQPVVSGQKSSSIGTGSGKINPPHGQPGHDCAVAVGAPLKN